MISWAAFKLLASGGLEALLKGLSAALNWLLADWRNLAVTIFGVAALWQGWVTIPARDRTIADTEALLTATQLAHIGTIASFMDASEQAQRDAETNAERVRTEQEAITDAKVSLYRGDLAALDQRFDRLRARYAAAADPGGGDPVGVPGLPAAPGRSDAASPDHNLRAAGELTAQAGCPIGLVCMTIDEAKAASQDAHRHNRLIDWVLAQSAVRFVPAEPRK